MSNLQPEIEMPRCARRSCVGGFTLIELLVVIAIIAILAALHRGLIGKCAKSQ